VIKPQFSPRALRRLELAAGLMPALCKKRVAPGDGFHLRTRAAIELLSPATRDHLRSLVDWLEDYERIEATLTAGGPRAGTTQQRKSHHG
jgi:hypothetical protein